MAKQLLFCTLCFLTVSPALAQVAYTWIDNNGVLHFSDTPDHPNAQIVELPEFDFSSVTNNNADQEATTSPTQTSLPSEQIKPELVPLTFIFHTPEHDQVIRSNNGNITVEVKLNRALFAGEQLQLWLDNQPYQAPQIATAWQLKNIDRGTHQIQIKVLQGGKQIASSSLITVHLQRATINQS
ncbi:MAG TPA: nitrogen regulation protein NR [Vibrio sp.]|nr:nitrogen regulation protein NR [Vibrio sp.]